MPVPHHGTQNNSSITAPLDALSLAHVEAGQGLASLHALCKRKPQAKQVFELREETLSILVQVSAELNRAQEDYQLETNESSSKAWGEFITGKDITGLEKSAFFGRRYLTDVEKEQEKKLDSYLEFVRKQRKEHQIRLEAFQKKRAVNVVQKAWRANRDRVVYRNRIARELREAAIKEASLEVATTEPEPEPEPQVHHTPIRESVKKIDKQINKPEEPQVLPSEPQPQLAKQPPVSRRYRRASVVLPEGGVMSDPAPHLIDAEATEPEVGGTYESPISPVLEKSNHKPDPVKLADPVASPQPAAAPQAKTSSKRPVVTRHAAQPLYKVEFPEQAADAPTKSDKPAWTGRGGLRSERLDSIQMTGAYQDPTLGPEADDESGVFVVPMRPTGFTAEMWNALDHSEQQRILALESGWGKDWKRPGHDDGFFLRYEFMNDPCDRPPPSYEYGGPPGPAKLHVGPADVSAYYKPAPEPVHTKAIWEKGGNPGEVYTIHGWVKLEDVEGSANEGGANPTPPPVGAGALGARSLRTGGAVARPVVGRAAHKQATQKDTIWETAGFSANRTNTSNLDFHRTNTSNLDFHRSNTSNLESNNSALRAGPSQVDSTDLRPQRSAESVSFSGPAVRTLPATWLILQGNSLDQGTQMPAALGTVNGAPAAGAANAPASVFTHKSADAANVDSFGMFAERWERSDNGGMLRMQTRMNGRNDPLSPTKKPSHLSPPDGLQSAASLTLVSPGSGTLVAGGPLIAGPRTPHRPPATNRSFGGSEILSRRLVAKNMNSNAESRSPKASVITAAECGLVLDCRSAGNFIQQLEGIGGGDDDFSHPNSVDNDDDGTTRVAASAVAKGRPRPNQLSIPTHSEQSTTTPLTRVPTTELRPRASSVPTVRELLYCSMDSTPCTRAQSLTTANNAFVRQSTSSHRTSLEFVATEGASHARAGRGSTEPMAAVEQIPSSRSNNVRSSVEHMPVGSPPARSGVTEGTLGQPAKSSGGVLGSLRTFTQGVAQRFKFGSKVSTGKESSNLQPQGHLPSLTSGTVSPQSTGLRSPPQRQNTNSGQVALPRLG